MLALTPSQRADAEAGIRWWNSIREYDRALWLTRAGTSCPADAWALFKSTCHPHVADAYDAAQVLP